MVWIGSNSFALLFGPRRGSPFTVDCACENHNNASIASQPLDPCSAGIAVVHSRPLRRD